MREGERPIKAQTYFLFLAVFASGAAVMMVEFLGTRILSPYYGTTLYVWSSLIAVTLGFLALGYFWGGRIADRHPEMSRLYLLIFLAGISVVIVSRAANWVLLATEPLGVRWGPLVAALVLFSVPTLALGMVTPLAVKLRTEALNVLGVTTGRLYALSTCGSLIGTIVTGFYLIPTFSISAIMGATAIGLILISGIWFILDREGRKKNIKFTVLLLAFLLPPFRPSLPPGEKLIAQAQSFYGPVKVVDYTKDGANQRFLFVNGATHTDIDITTGQTDFSYLQLMDQAVAYRPQATSALSIGLGGGVLDGILRSQGLAVQNLEIDPAVVDLAKKYFGFDGQVTIADGRAYLRHTDQKYGLIFTDAFTGFSIVPYLVTQEAFHEVKNALEPGGIFVMNTLGFESHLQGNDALTQAVYQTLKQVFQNVAVKSTGYGFNNIIFFASDGPLVLNKWYVTLTVTPDRQTPVLTDDINPAERLAEPNIEAWREATIGSFGSPLMFTNSAT